MFLFGTRSPPLIIHHSKLEVIKPELFRPRRFSKLQVNDPPPPRQSDGWVPRSSMVSLKRAHGHWLVLVSSLAEVQG